MSSHIKRSRLLVFIIAITSLLIALFILSSARVVMANDAPFTTIAEQGFGNDTATWTFTPTVLMITPTNSYSNAGTTMPTMANTNLFAPVESLIMKPPAAGSWFWGMKDLSTCEFTYCQVFDHELAFEEVAISNSACAVLSIDYFAANFDQIVQADPNYLSYSIVEDSRPAITGTLVSNENVNSWQTFTHDVTNTTTSVTLKLFASHDGEAGFAGFDNVTLKTQTCVPLAVTTSSISTATTSMMPLLIAFLALVAVTVLPLRHVRREQNGI